MTHKISTEWFSPTDDMVKFKEHSKPEYSHYEFKFGRIGPERCVKFKMRYNGKSQTFSSHTENYAAGVSKDKKTVTLRFDLTAAEQKYRNENWRNLPEGYYEKNYITIPYEEFLEKVEIQYTGVDKYNAICDNLEVGDFIRLSGQRDKSSWRKIMKLDWDRNQVFGWKYRQPIDEEGYDTRDSSDNMITTVIEHVKNPKNENS